jgi:hypothetical protein
MFNSKHYVPILKWKRAEQGALKALSDKYRKNITPVIQFVMPKDKSEKGLEHIIELAKSQLDENVEKLIEFWGTAPAFIDVSLLYSAALKAHSLKVIIENGKMLGGNLIPVIHTTDDEQIKLSAIALNEKLKMGLCVRVTRLDLADMKELNKTISYILSKGLTEKEVDLLVDIKEIEEGEEQYSKYISLSQNIPDLLNWRTFTFASGAFPKDMSACKLDEENIIARLDWQFWKKYGNSQLKRIPTFSDYTIQHPIYKDSTQFFPPTTSIKYALENEWLIMKGEKQKFDKYLASAALLAKDKRFYGEKFSDGDKYIVEKARHFLIYIKKPSIKGTGSTETWLKAGINHHLSLAAYQISNLALK